MKKILKNDFTVLLLRLLPLYICIFITQIAFYLYNRMLLGSLTWSEIPMLLAGSLKFATASIFFLNAPFILLSLLPFRFRQKNGYQKMLLWLYGITNSIGLVVLNLSDAVYFRYAFKRISSEEMHFFRENDSTFGVLLKALGENWYLVLLGAVLIFLLVFVYKKIKYHPTQLSNNWLYYGVGVLGLAIAVPLWILGIRGSVDKKAFPMMIGNVAYYTQSPQKGALVLSNPFCLFRTIGKHQLESPDYFSEDELADVYSPYHYPHLAQEPVAKGKNVVIFVLESFSREHSHYLAPHLNPNGGYTPFLDSLMQEGLVFTNAYANGMKSIEALPSIFSSIPSYRAPFALMPQSLTDLEALPRILARQGYNTHFFCGATKNQMGFEAFGTLCGIENFHNREDFEKLHPEKGNANVWGIWDMPFLQYVAEEINRQETPFFTAVFTLSSHHPYDLPEGYMERMPKGNTLVQPCVAYTDLSLRSFFETASKMPWYENTLFIFVADHVSPQIAAEETRTARGNTAIIYFMYTPDHSIKGRYEHVTQQIDIMPTTLGLMGYDKPYFAFGRDVFNEPERKPLVVNCVQQTYQALTDSLSLYFDGERRLFVYSATDTLQQHNILDMNSLPQKSLERDLKATLQSYYAHVGKGDLLPANSEKK
ncbi:MAG: sulfatase-like hydrolase/transferase [Bacteroidales bacterium]|nr:sulfatase-like hydrolase/transferase [Bacteroidales bacterium]